MLISPLPGTNRENLLESLRSLATTVGNLWTSGPRETLELALKYLEWANDAVELLDGQISPQDIDRLVLTRRHEQIMSNIAVLAAPDTARFSNGLIHLELRQRAKAFETAVATLQMAIADRLIGVSNLVFDTTVYIKHPEKLEEIDFGKLVDDHDAQLNLVVPMVVLDELDRLKESSNRDTRWRAGYSLAVIDRLFPSPRRQYGLLQKGGDFGGRVSMEILYDPRGHVRLPDADDEIVDRTAAFEPLAGDTTLFTYDTGMSMRGRQAMLIVRKLTRPLEDEPTEEAAGTSRRAQRRQKREEREGAGPAEMPAEGS
ncbi:PIN domain-containing protein [Kitasatospora sp. CB01950]|uniref:PIN domain-containing protein n=1 Tax=Kitasatospora sp. CB01950 TaxID=1703930 RepID=UPI000940540C|nr:PIN domain-containing protein [Kitasatospora sp. CB01950]OKI99931.1 hypothetical protein AMK19_30935 [Kitasatospora sp. CB01950]